MKKRIYLLLTGLWLGIFSFAQAQSQAAGDFSQEKPLQLLAKLSNDLDLTETQKNQLRDLGEKYRPILQEQRQKLADAGKMTKFQAFRKIKKDIQADLQNILSPDQFQKFQAQKQAMRSQMREKMKGFRENGGMEKLQAMRQEIQAYREKNIQPILQKQRNLLENQLSEADKQSLNQIRGNLKNYKNEAKDLRKNLTANREKRTPLNEEQKQQLKNLKTKGQSDFAEAKKIAEKYQPQMDELFQQISENQAHWKADIQAIMKKYLDDADLLKRFSGDKDKLGKWQKNRDKVPFLLMKAENSNKENSAEGRELNVFPNPASAYNLVQFEIKKAGKVQIDLLNKEGQVVKNILNEHRETGKHSLEVNTQDLQNSIYFYRITDNQGTETKRLIVQK